MRTDRTLSPLHIRLTSCALASALALCALSCEDLEYLPYPIQTFAQLSLLNLSNEAHDITLRILPAELAIPCINLSTVPEQLQHHWGSPATSPFIDAKAIKLTLQPGQELPLDAQAINSIQCNSYYNGDDDYLPPYDLCYYEENDPLINPALCRGAMIESPTLGRQLIAWPSDLPQKNFYIDVDIPRNIPPDPQTITINADYSKVPSSATRLAWRELDCGLWVNPTCSADDLARTRTIPQDATYTLNAPLHRPRPIPIPDATDLSACAQFNRNNANFFSSLEWVELLSISDQRDEGLLSCARFEAFNAQTQRTSTICAPKEALNLFTPQEGRRVFYKNAKFDNPVELLHTTSAGSISSRWIIDKIELELWPGVPASLHDDDLSVMLDPNAPPMPCADALVCGQYIDAPLILARKDALDLRLNAKTSAKLPDGSTYYLTKASRALYVSSSCFNPNTVADQGTGIGVTATIIYSKRL